MCTNRKSRTRAVFVAATDQNIPEILKMYYTPMVSEKMGCSMRTWAIRSSCKYSASEIPANTDLWSFKVTWWTCTDTSQCCRYSSDSRTTWHKYPCQCCVSIKIVSTSCTCSTSVQHKYVCFWYTPVATSVVGKRICMYIWFTSTCLFQQPKFRHLVINISVSGYRRPVRFYWCVWKPKKTLQYFQCLFTWRDVYLMYTNTHSQSLFSCQHLAKYEFLHSLFDLI